MSNVIWKDLTPRVWPRETWLAQLFQSIPSLKLCAHVLSLQRLAVTGPRSVIQLDSAWYRCFSGATARAVILPLDPDGWLVHIIVTPTEWKDGSMGFIHSMTRQVRLVGRILLCFRLTFCLMGDPECCDVIWKDLTPRVRKDLTPQKLGS